MAHAAIAIGAALLLLAALVFLTWGPVGPHSDMSPTGAPTPSPTPTHASLSGRCGTAQGLDIQSQPKSSLQIVNCTSESPLHVFLGTRTNAWVKLGGSPEAAVNGAIDWGKRDLPAWDPVGAGLLSEAVIPRGGFLVLGLPSDMQGHAFRVTPLKLRNNDSTPLTSSAMAHTRVVKQWPILLEGGQDVVADSSAVDGINFKMKYELTSDGGAIKTMEVHQNPCQGLDSKYLLDVGCRCPASVDCPKSMPTCECHPSTQICKFNKCSDILFSVPANLDRYFNEYDGGEDVKKFINRSSNLKPDGALSRYCQALQANSGDFTAYCYDYNDLSSSPWLRSPYKMRVTYTDLTAS